MDRIDVLLKAHEKEETASLKRSGTEEKFNRFKEMLGEISSLRKTSETNAQEAKKAKARKKEDSAQVGLEIVAAGEATYARSGTCTEMHSFVFQKSKYLNKLFCSVTRKTAGAFALVAPPYHSEQYEEPQSANFKVPFIR